MAVVSAGVLSCATRGDRPSALGDVFRVVQALAMLRASRMRVGTATAVTALTTEGLMRKAWMSNCGTLVVLVQVPPLMTVLVTFTLTLRGGCCGRRHCGWTRRRHLHR